MTDKEYFKSLRIPDENNPLRILVSSCLLGALCGADGSSYGNYPHITKLKKEGRLKLTPFCPEDYSFGTPRETPDILDGKGADVLDGKAKVITESGKDITKGMIEAAYKMLEVAITNNIELAILMDVSAACGSQVIYKGHRFSDNPTYQVGMGVCAALLDRKGFKVISQRDFRTLEILYSKIWPDHEIDSIAIDHNETAWYKEYFNKD